MTDAEGARSRGRDELQRALDIFEAATPASKGKSRHLRAKAKVDFTSPKEELSKSSIKLRDMRQTSRLRKQLAWFAILAVSTQLLIANVFFGYYLYQSQRSNSGFDSTVMVAWLSATVVEVVGIVVIVARNLFPATMGVSRRDMKKLLRAIDN